MMMLAFLLCMGGMLCAHARHRAPPPSRCAPSLCMDLHQWRAARSRAGRLRQLNPARAALHLAQCGSGKPACARSACIGRPTAYRDPRVLPARGATGTDGVGDARCGRCTTRDARWPCCEMRDGCAAACAARDARRGEGRCLATNVPVAQFDFGLRPACPPPALPPSAAGGQCAARAS